MTATRKLLGIPALLAVTLATLSACVPTVPMPTPTPTESSATPTRTATPRPTPTPTADPLVAATIAIDAIALTITTADGEVITTLPFAEDGDAAAAELSEAIGLEPTVSYLGESSCRAETTVYAWGGLKIHVPGEIIAAPGAIFTVTAESTATNNGVSIVGPGGQPVGTALAAAYSALPDAMTVDDTRIGMDVGASNGADSWGTLGLSNSGVITSIMSPVYFYGDC